MVPEEKGKKRQMGCGREKMEEREQEIVNQGEMEQTTWWIKRE